MDNSPAPVAPALPQPHGLLSTMRMVHCRELLAEFPVDAAVARKAVPPPYSARIYPGGHANLLLLVQECEKAVLDRLLIVRPMRMAHAWIELAGPEETLPALAGTSASLPTSYWYAMPHHIESRLAAFSLRAVGIDVQPVRRVSAGGAPGVTRHGAVLERGVPHTGYSWDETTTLWNTPRVVTGRRWFYREYGTTIPRRSVGLVVCRAAFLGEGQITLGAERDSVIGRLGFGTTLRGTTNAVEMDCDVRIRVGRR